MNFIGKFTFLGMQKDKWRLSFLLCAREDVLNGCITVGSHLCNDTLMLSGGGQLVKTFFFYIIDDGILNQSASNAYHIEL